MKTESIGRKKVRAALLKLSKEVEAKRVQWHLALNRVTSQQELEDLGYEPVGTHHQGAFGAYPKKVYKGANEERSWRELEDKLLDVAGLTRKYKVFSCTLERDSVVLPNSVLGVVETRRLSPDLSMRVVFTLRRKR